MSRSRCWPDRWPPFVAAGNLTANLIRNMWAFMIIFCGHFPEDVQQAVRTVVNKIVKLALLPRERVARLLPFGPEGAAEPELAPA